MLAAMGTDVIRDKLHWKPCALGEDVVHASSLEIVELMPRTKQLTSLPRAIAIGSAVQGESRLRNR